MFSASVTRTLSGHQKGHWERSKRLLKTLKKKKKKKNPGVIGPGTSKQNSPVPSWFKKVLALRSNVYLTHMELKE